MAFHAPDNAPEWSMPRATKRRTPDEHTDDNEAIKRLSCQHHRSVDMATSAPQQELPPITYASPDYRPPPRADALWLQPVQHTSSMMMDEELTDEEALLTPLPSTHQPQHQPKHATIDASAAGMLHPAPLFPHQVQA